MTHKCKYPDCDGGPATGYCHKDCPIVMVHIDGPKDDDNYEEFFCTSCGWRTMRLKGSFDFPICATCRAYDEIDPTGELKKERLRRIT
jgi:hypothetical protein